MQEMRVWSLGWEDPLEEDMAAHSSILTWKIPWTEEPGGLQSMRMKNSRTQFSNNKWYYFKRTLAVVVSCFKEAITHFIKSNLRCFEIDGFSILLECSQWNISCNYIMTSRRRKWQPNPVHLPGKSHGRGSLAGCSPWGRKASDRTEWLHFLSLHHDCHLGDNCCMTHWLHPVFPDGC